MFNYQDTGRFLTPAINRHSRKENSDAFDPEQMFSTIKQSRFNTGARQNRRFGTNLTNKRPISRLQFDYSKTTQVNKPFKQINYASKQGSDMLFKPQNQFKLNVIQPQQQSRFGDVEEPEYCPSPAPSDAARDETMDGLFDQVFQCIGSYKQFVPSRGISFLDYEIVESFQYLNESSLSVRLYDSDTDDEKYDMNDVELVPMLDFEIEDIFLDFNM